MKSKLYDLFNLKLAIHQNSLFLKFQKVSFKLVHKSILGSSKVFKKLYNEAKIISQRKMLHSKSQKCPFKPEIGDLNRKLGKTDDDRDAFYTRMMNSKKFSDEALEAMRQEIHFMESTYDPNTGQEFYKPKITKYENVEEAR